MTHTAALQTLRETATGERVGDRTARRLSDAHAIVGEELALVEAELSRAVREGAKPGTFAATHLMHGGGKRVRPMAALLAAACFGPVPPAAREVAVVAELVHAATLLHDDVIDDADERRGRPASRRLWGNAVSVLAGDLLLTHALTRTSEAAPSLLRDLLATMRALVDGEIVQLRGRTHVDLSEATYFAIVRDKTASLFAWAARSGGVVAGAPLDACDALGRFGAHVGVAFQVVDDVLDYTGDSKATGKALYGDLREGKMTLPLVRAIAARPMLAREVDRARAGDEDACAGLLRAVVESGVCDDVRELARTESRRAVEALSRVPACASRDLLACVATELAARVA